jgi:hypothetical protein
MKPIRAFGNALPAEVDRKEGKSGERCRSVGRQEAAAERPWLWGTQAGASPSDVALAPISIHTDRSIRTSYGESETLTSTLAVRCHAFPGGG